MPRSELAHLELLAEVDSLVDRLNRWAESAPPWQPAEKCRALVRRLTERADLAAGADRSPAGRGHARRHGHRQECPRECACGGRSGADRPVAAHHHAAHARLSPRLTPEMLGIDPASVEVVQRDLPALRDLVLVDCPDPDTTEEDADRTGPLPNGREPESSRRRGPYAAGPHRATWRGCGRFCRSATCCWSPPRNRSIAAPGWPTSWPPRRRARTWFSSQTHADLDDDIRDDWRQCWRRQVSPLSRLGEGQGVRAAARLGKQRCHLAAGRPHPNPLPKGEGTRVRPSSSASIRFAPWPTHKTACSRGASSPICSICSPGRWPARPATASAGPTSSNWPPIRSTPAAAGSTKRCRACGKCKPPSTNSAPALAQQIAAEMQAELLANRRQWENRLLAQTASRWGLSPFALVLRVYQGIGGLLSGALLYRARTPAQMALWGALEGVRTWRKHRQTRQADRGVDRASVGGFDPAELRKAAIIVDGYVAEARAGWQTFLSARGRQECLPHLLR